MTRKRHRLIEFHYHFRSRNYKNSFGRNSNNTWHELPEKIRKKLREMVEERDGLVCSKKYGHGCGLVVSNLSLDHIIPVRAGGPVCDMNNLQLLCEPCHNRKTAEIDVQYTTLYQCRKH